MNEEFNPTQRPTKDTLSEIELLNLKINELKEKLGSYNTVQLNYFNLKSYPSDIALKAKWANAIYYFTINDNDITELNNAYYKIQFDSYLKITKEEDFSMFDGKIDNSRFIEHKNRKSFHYPEDAFLTLPKDCKITIISKKQFENFIKKCVDKFDDLYFDADNPKNDLSTLY